MNLFATHADDSSPANRSFVLFTDGACIGNPGPGGWAYVLRDADSGEEAVEFGGERKTTNNRMELTAVIEGLLALPDPSQVKIVSDSQYVLFGMRDWMPGWKAKGWRKADRKPVLNVELWQQLDALMQRHRIEFEWIRGHTGHAENERCDQLATEEAKRQSKGVRS